MINPKMPDWMIPAGLVALSAVPVIAGGHRLTRLGGGLATPDSARFIADPWPVALHVGSATVFSVLGAFQFSPAFRRTNATWHRVAGRVLLPCGFLVAISGLWMTQFYPRVELDGRVLYVIRLLVGAAMTLFLGLAIGAIYRRNFSEHGKWMIRAYALALGAGTQVFTHLPWLLFPASRGEFTRTLFMALGWLINLVAAECIIRGNPTIGMPGSFKSNKNAVT